MRIIQLTAENIKKLKAVEITPGPDGFVLVTGKNGSGKSSVLDAIWYALAGQGAIPEQPIRTGTDKARVRLNLGEIIVERRFTADSTTLKVSSAAGAVYQSPQTILDALVGELTFDPLEFTRMAPKAQFEALRVTAKIDYDFAESDALDRGDYESRTEVNRELKMLKSQLAGIQVPEDAPNEPVDLAGLMAEFNRITSHNRAIDSAKARHKQLLGDRRRLENEIARLQEEIASIDDLIASLAIAAPLDASQVQTAIAGAQAKNDAYSARKRADELRARINTAQENSDAFTARMDKRGLERMTVLSEAELPAGLTFGNGIILLGGVPFEQASSAEQLRASCQVAMAANPKLRVLRIKDGSLLDADSLRILAETTGAADYQVWCERVDTTGTVGVYLEDGEVVSQEGTAAPPTAATAEPPTPKRRRGAVTKQSAAEAAAGPGNALNEFFPTPKPNEET